MGVTGVGLALPLIGESHFKEVGRMVIGLGAHLPLSESQANRSAGGQVYCSKASTDFEQQALRSADQR